MSWCGDKDSEISSDTQYIRPLQNCEDGNGVTLGWLLSLLSLEIRLCLNAILLKFHIS